MPIPAEDTGLSSAIDRMRLVRTQEAKVQIEKSIGELQGIAVQIASINAELVNNRIDTRTVRFDLRKRFASQF